MIIESKLCFALKKKKKKKNVTVHWQEREREILATKNTTISTRFT
jgi:hypothetical protein